MRSIFLCLATLLTSTALAQTDQKFIEFTVQDTVQIVPDKLIYQVSFFDEGNPLWEGLNEEFSANRQQQMEKQKLAKASFFKICSQLNIQPELRQSSRYKTKSNSFTEKYQITFVSEKELNTFYEQVKSLALQGSVADIYTSPKRIESAKLRLLTKIKNQAGLQAEQTSRLFNKTSGELISLKIEPEKSIYSVSPLEGTFDFGVDFRPEKLVETIDMSVTFRYAIK